jgi:serine protease Do
MKSKPMLRTLLATGLAVALITGCAQAQLPFSHHANAPVDNGASTAVSAPSTSVALPDFSALVDRYGAAVVNVSTTGNTKVSTAAPDFPGMDPDDPFWQFFRRFQIPLPQHDVPMQGLGSGFIVSSDGVILTNAHVIDDAKEVTVKLTDKREFKAKVVGKDKQSDVAVLKINADRLPTVKLGDSDQVRVGTWVVAIGSPFGFENSVTAGIVSAKARSLPGDSYVAFLQTDVPVNPGNSGGPLFNLNGEVIGINSQIYTRSGGFQGLSFAIPINVAVKVENDLQQHGHVTRGRLGVTIQEVTATLADSFGLKKASGALVSAVDPNGPAAKAGLESGDVILKLDGKDIAQSADLPALVAELKPGATAKLQIWRHGATKDVSVNIGELQDNVATAAKESATDSGRLGLVVRPLTPEERQQAGVKGGLLVNDSSGPAASAGIQPGDVILAMNGNPVNNVAQLRELAAKAGAHVALLVERNHAQIFVPLNLG